jgi:hypothetical protein
VKCEPAVRDAAAFAGGDEEDALALATAADALPLALAEAAAEALALALAEAAAEALADALAVAEAPVAPVALAVLPAAALAGSVGAPLATVAGAVARGAELATGGAGSGVGLSQPLHAAAPAQRTPRTGPKSRPSFIGVHHGAKRSKREVACAMGEGCSEWFRWPPLR